MTGLDARIAAFIQHDPEPGEGDERFGALALELFADQYERNLPYRRFCRSRRAEPGRLRSWTEIPAVPLSGFKDLTLSCEPPERAAAVFETSGSTDPARRGRNHHPHLRLYDASLRSGFARWFLPDRERMRLLVINPSPEAQPRSSLAYFLGRLVDFFGTPDSGWFVGGDGIAVDRLVDELSRAQGEGEPVALLGTSFAYVHLLDDLSRRGVRLTLPDGSRLLDTGGFKGRSREISSDELLTAFEHAFGLAPSRCVNYYGMTEISTQYYDDHLPASLRGDDRSPRRKAVPHWARVRLVDPETGSQVAAGQRGLIVHYDLANRGSCLAVMAEDVGERPSGEPQDSAAPFRLLGRAEGTQARGCSIALDELLAASLAPR